MVALPLILNREKYMGLVVALPFFDNIAVFYTSVCNTVSVGCAGTLGTA